MKRQYRKGPAKESLESVQVEESSQNFEVVGRPSRRLGCLGQLLGERGMTQVGEN